MNIIDLKETILQDNDADARLLRSELMNQGIVLMNLMSAPGSGKTTTLLALNKYFQGKMPWAVMEADIDSDVDALTLEAAGVPSIQLHTGGMCHLDADMTRQGVKAFCETHPEFPGGFMVLENIGNLVCPAEYDTGASINLTLLSVPEGDDKPAKYPLMYRVADVLVVNKIDAMAVFNFDKERIEKDVKSLNPNIKIFYISAKTGEGVEELANYLMDRTKAILSGDESAVGAACDVLRTIKHV